MDVTAEIFKIPFSIIKQYTQEKTMCIQQTKIIIMNLKYHTTNLYNYITAQNIECFKLWTQTFLYLAFKYKLLLEIPRPKQWFCLTKFQFNFNHFTDLKLERNNLYFSFYNSFLLLLVWKGLFSQWSSKFLLGPTEKYFLSANTPLPGFLQ